MDFRILGNLEVAVGSRLVSAGGPREQVVLGVLLLDVGRVVPVARLVDALWLDDPPATAVRQVQNAVSRLRRQISEPGFTVNAVGGGYRLTLEDGRLDTWMFETKVAEAQRAASAGQLSDAAGALREALGLRRGRLLEGLTGRIIESAAANWEERRRSAEDAYYEYMLRLGRHREIVAELGCLVGGDPIREITAGQLMLARYRSGDQAAALQTYQTTGDRLREDLGVDPGPELRRLHHQILNHEPALQWQGSPAGQAPASQASAWRVVPRQLPGAVRHFTGRARELKALTDLLSQADESPGAVVISAIDGTAGVGKTALALYWAHQVAEHFPDGQLYVNLRGFDPAAPPVATADALHGFFDAFEVPAARIPESLEAQVSLYRSLMAGRRALVVLDNARDAEQVSHLLPGASECLALVTSRCRLTGLAVAHGAQPITLGMFTGFEARAFLSRRLGAEQIAAETGAVAELIELCAGLPLALSIVAAQALTRPALSLAVLVSQLRDMTRRLDVLDSGDRATGIRPVISWSYRNLSAEAARMFRLMAMHPGPDISVPAAASLVGIPCPDARGVLAELARAHMMTEHASGRFAFHDLLRAYAGEQARAIDSAAARRAAVNRILDYYLHAGHTATLLLNPARDSVVLAAPASGVVSDQIVRHADASAWFTAEYQVLLAVISQAFGESFHVHAWKIAWTLDTFLEASGRWHVMAKVHRIALAAAQRQGDDVGQGSAHCDLGATDIRLGLHDEATAHLQQAIRLAQRCGDQAGLARCHYTLGWAFAEQGKHSEALDHARQALTLFTATGHSQGQAGALSCLAWCLAHTGDIQSAVAYGERALRLQRELRNGIGEADTWDILGQAHYRDGRFDQAVAHYQRAIDLCCQLGDRYAEAQVRQHIGEAHLSAGDARAARDSWGQALVILDELEHPDAEKLRSRLRGLANVVVA